MAHILNACSRLTEFRYWWMHAMVILWLLFMFMLYVIEPNVLQKKNKNEIQPGSDKTIFMIQKTHWILLLFSLITIIGTTTGSHGWMLSEN